MFIGAEPVPIALPLSGSLFIGHGTKSFTKPPAGTVPVFVTSV
jgi:hypothetical protein